MTTPAHGSRASREPANRWRSSGQTGWDPDLASAGDDFGIAPLELANLPDTDNRAAAVYLTTAKAVQGRGSRHSQGRRRVCLWPEWW